MYKKYLDYATDQLKKIMAIPSPSSYTKEVTDYLVNEFNSFGAIATKTIKGGVIVDLDSNKNKENSILLAAHTDTLGAMVAEIKSDGKIRLTEIGGLQPNNIEGENCVIHTRFNGDYDGTIQLIDASVHVNGDYKSINRNWDTIECVIDMEVENKKDVEDLGIMVGDVITVDPRTTITKSGFIKSRFLDDKLSVAILLAYAKYLKEENVTTNRNVYLYITVYEEIGHGATSSIPQCVTEILGVDMGCVGKGLNCKETQVSICASDSFSPSNYDNVTKLIEVARENNIDFAVDVYPHYSSDVDKALLSGHECTHCLIGSGVYASHGYERSHIKGLCNTFDLVEKYIDKY